MTAQEFVDRLVVAVPETRDLVAEHLEDQSGELLLHLMMADLLRFAVAQYHVGQADVSARCLKSVDDAFRLGDEYVENAVAVSFVENAGLGEGETADFIAAWPRVLAEERVRQQQSS